MFTTRNSRAYVLRCSCHVLFDTCSEHIFRKLKLREQFWIYIKNLISWKNTDGAQTVEQCEDQRKRIRRRPAVQLIDANRPKSIFQSRQTRSSMHLLHKLTGSTCFLETTNFGEGVRDFEIKKNPYFHRRFIIFNGISVVRVLNPCGEDNE